MLKPEHKTANPPVLRVVESGKNLLGMFGHTINKHGFIEWQFSIEKEISFNRYLVQLYSWWDGSPTEVKALGEYKLLGPRCKLYLTREDWDRAAEKNDLRKARTNVAE